jgi:hypothetical protein
MPLNFTAITSPSSRPSDLTQSLGKITKYEPLCSCSFLLTSYSLGIFYFLFLALITIERNISIYLHTKWRGVHILLENTNYSHTLEELAFQRIPIFTERGAENNREILACVALNGSMLKYDIAKKTKMLNSTASRRVDALAERGYLGEAGKRLTQRGRQAEETMYGLTWKGFVASATIEEVRKNTVLVLERNSLLAFPEKELVLPITKEIAETEDIDTLITSLTKAILESIPNLEPVDEKQMPALILSAFTRLQLPKDFKLSKIPKDAWELLDRPTILKAVKEIVVPFFKQYADSAKAMYLLVSAFDGFDIFFGKLDVSDQPSKKIKEFLEKGFQKLSKNSEKMFMVEEGKH